VVESARLESVWSGNRPKGSNPFPSADRKMLLDVIQRTYGGGRGVRKTLTLSRSRLVGMMFNGQAYRTLNPTVRVRVPVPALLVETQHESGVAVSLASGSLRVTTG
jgi:hypothetical protein